MMDHLTALCYGLDDEALAPVLLGRRMVRQKRLDRASVDKRRRLGPCQVGESRGQVVVERHLMEGLAFGHAGTAYDQRYTDVLLVWRPLTCIQTVLAQVEAMIARKEYVGIRELAA